MAGSIRRGNDGRRKPVNRWKEANGRSGGKEWKEARQAGSGGAASHEVQ